MIMLKLLEYWEKKFEESKDNILPDNYMLLKRHIRRMKNGKQTERTIANHLQALIPFSEWCKKSFEALNEDDILDYCDVLNGHKHNSLGESKKLADSTIYFHKSVIKTFLKNINISAFNALQMKKVKRLPKNVFTKEDIEALINAAPNARDRALIACFYESGARKSELLGTTINDVQFDQWGAVLKLAYGKTGERRIRLVYAASYLREWLNVHPLKDKQEAVIFCSLRYPYNVISQNGLHDQLNIIAEKAGINKPVNPHQFRHSRATHLAEHLTEQQLKTYLGWTKSSAMASIYVHLSGEDLDPTILRMHGIEPDKERKNTDLSIIRCPRCKDINADSAVFCWKCGMPLTQDASTTVESIKTDYMQFAEFDEIREMKNALKQELEEISKMKEMMLKAKK